MQNTSFTGWRNRHSNRLPLFGEDMLPTIGDLETINEEIIVLQALIGPSGTPVFAGLGLGGTPVATAILDIQSTTKGILFPRMTTTQRDAIGSPATGLSIYNTSTNKFNYYNGTVWEVIDTSTGGDVSGTGTTGKLMKWTDGAGSVAGDSLISEVGTNINIAGNFVMTSGATIRAGNTLNDFFVIQAMNTNTLDLITFATLTSAGTPTFDLSDAVTKAGQYIYRVGGTDISVADGGTGASTAADARTNLGLAIGINVQAYDATLQSLSTLGTAVDKLAYTTGIDTWSETTITSFARTILDDTTATSVRNTLGLTTSTGWTAITGTASKAGYNTTTANLSQVAETVKAIQDHLITIGILNV